MKKKIVIDVLLLLLTVIFITGAIFLETWVVNFHQANKNIVTRDVYTGRFILQEEEYSHFKRILADNPKIYIEKLEVLSSPDALIDMEISVPSDIEMPYGEITTSYYKSDFGSFYKVKEWKQ